MDLTCKFAVLTNKKSLDSAVTSDCATSAQTLVHNGTVKEYKVLHTKEVEIHSSKVNVTASDATLIDTYIDNNCHFCDSSENIIPDPCEDIMMNTISLSDF